MTALNGRLMNERSIVHTMGSREIGKSPALLHTSSSCRSAGKSLHLSPLQYRRLPGPPSFVEKKPYIEDYCC